MPTKDEVRTYRGAELRGAGDEKIGKIEEIYVDEQTEEPEWALVNTGLFGTKRSFVPLAQARREGDAVCVPYEKDQVKGAPQVDPDGELTQREEAELYRHYGLDYSESRSESGLPEGAAGGTTTVGAAGTGTAGTAGTAASGGEHGAAGGTSSAADLTGEDAMTRSEEELRVGTTERERGRVRLKKWVETEDVEESVPLRREEPRIEREPITDENVDEAMSGAEITEAEHEVVLREEEPVAEKRTVPKERVRLDKDVQTEEREVSDTVRRERIDVDRESDRS